MKYFTLIAATIMPMLGFLGAAQTINPDCVPSGHFKSGTASCHCSGGSVTCEPFTLCGVGNKDATVELSSTSTATVRCQNKGGKIVDVKTQDVTTSTKPPPLHSNKNGCMNVPSVSATPTEEEINAKATCPNPNWTKKPLEGSIVLKSFTYTLSFDGCAYITITSCT